MSRSYRKPYASICGNGSAKKDKQIASRCWRRAQNQRLNHAIKNEEDWDEVLIPVRYEASSNDVWGWNRDGKQTSRRRSQQYNNPFYHVRNPQFRTDEEIFEKWEERNEWEDDWIKSLTRK